MNFIPVSGLVAIEPKGAPEPFEGASLPQAASRALASAAAIAGPRVLVSRWIRARIMDVLRKVSGARVLVMARTTPAGDSSRPGWPPPAWSRQPEPTASTSGAREEAG